MAEWTAILRPRTEPVSDRGTAFVIAAVTIELMRHREHVKGNRRATKSDTSLIKVWNRNTQSWLVQVDFFENGMKITPHMFLVHQKQAYLCYNWPDGRLYRTIYSGISWLRTLTLRTFEKWTWRTFDARFAIDFNNMPHFLVAWKHDFC